MHRRRPLGIACSLALLCTASSVTAEPAGFADPSLPSARSGSGSALLASLAFTVSVCLDDVEYSIACRQRSLLDAAKRLEQLYFDDYTNRRVSGTLMVRFAIPVDAAEQLRFLREVDDRAIAATVAKVQAELDHFTATTPPAIAATMAQQLEVWRETAAAEARLGSNWLHHWAERSHQHRSSPALDQLTRIRPGF